MSTSDTLYWHIWLFWLFYVHEWIVSVYLCLSTRLLHIALRDMKYFELDWSEIIVKANTVDTFYQLTSSMLICDVFTSITSNQFKRSNIRRSTLCNIVLSTLKYLVLCFVCMFNLVEEIWETLHNVSYGPSTPQSQLKERDIFLLFWRSAFIWECSHQLYVKK